MNKTKQTTTTILEPPLQHGSCPSCGESLDGGGIWQHFYDEFTQRGDWQLDGRYANGRFILSPEAAEIRADEVAESYGASRTKGRWGKAIGIYDMERDRTMAWKCPHCEYEWPR
jgi:predicted RNA-binding Zn-ribbon protein involved in translation (DUF1610 family)